MGILGDLLGMIVSGGIGAAGKISYEANQRKKRESFAAEFDARFNREAIAARDLAKTTPKDNSAVLKKEIEDRLGITLEEAEKQDRQYNLLLEYDLTIGMLERMKKEFTDTYPPGSTLRTVRRVRTKVDESNPHSAEDYLPIVSKIVLPDDEAKWEEIIEDEFWRQEMTSFVGPEYGRRVTLGVSTALYALGQSRIEIAVQGFLPSNCASRLWPYWNPYIDSVSLGDVHRNFDSKCNISRFIPNTWFIHRMATLEYSLTGRMLTSRSDVVKFAEEYETKRRLRPDLYH